MGLGNPCRRDWRRRVLYRFGGSGASAVVTGWRELDELVLVLPGWGRRVLLAGVAVSVMPAQEIQQQGIHLLGFLALHPVAAALDDVLLDPGDHLGHAFDGDALQFADRVAVADDELRRLRHLFASQI